MCALLGFIPSIGFWSYLELELIHICFMEGKYALLQERSIYKGMPITTTVNLGTG